MYSLRDHIIVSLIGTFADSINLTVQDWAATPFEGELNKIDMAIVNANATGLDVSDLLNKKLKLNNLIQSIKENKNLGEILDMIVDID